MISSSVSQLFYVETSKAINQGVSFIPIVKKTVRTSILFAIPFTIILLAFGPLIFRWYLGEEWRQAGLYAQGLAPMFFLYFILSPISGLPILLGKQKKAFLFSLIGYSLTIMAMFVGISLKFSFNNTLFLYGGVFALFYLATLIWYFTLIKKSNESLN